MLNSPTPYLAWYSQDFKGLLLRRNKRHIKALRQILASVKILAAFGDLCSPLFLICSDNYKDKFCIINSLKIALAFFCFFQKRTVVESQNPYLHATYSIS